MSAIERTIQKAFTLEAEIEFEKLVSETCREFSASRRHAIELINIVLNTIPHEIKKSNGDKLICKINGKTRIQQKEI